MHHPRTRMRSIYALPGRFITVALIRNLTSYRAIKNRPGITRARYHSLLCVSTIFTATGLDRIAVLYYALPLYYDCGGGYQPPPSHRSRVDSRWPHKQSPPVYHSQVRTIRIIHTDPYLFHCRVRSGQTWSCHHPHKVSGHGPSPHNPKDTKVVWRGSQCALTTSSTRDSDFDTNT
jgi:hypothetical protein